MILIRDFEIGNLGFRNQGVTNNYQSCSLSELDISDDIRTQA